MSTPFDEPGDTQGASPTLTPANENRTENDSMEKKVLPCEERRHEEIYEMTFEEFIHYLTEQPTEDENEEPLEERRSIRLTIPTDKKKKALLGQMMKDNPHLFCRPKSPEAEKEKPKFILTEGGRKSRRKNRSTTREPKRTPSQTDQQKKSKMDENLYEELFFFEKDSKLHLYLVDMMPYAFTKEVTDYPLGAVLRAMDNLITYDVMYDPQNPYIVLCDHALEEALGLKAFHCTEMIEIITKQFRPVQERIGRESQQAFMTRSFKTKPSNDPDGAFFPSWGSPTALAAVARVYKIKTNIGKRNSYKVKPALLKVLRTVEGMDQEEEIFEYIDIVKTLARYIFANKRYLLDDRHPHIALVHKDPLGDAFGVRAFTYSQFFSLLSCQLIFTSLSNHLDAVIDRRRFTSYEEKEIQKNIGKDANWLYLHDDIDLYDHMDCVLPVGFDQYNKYTKWTLYPETEDLTQNQKMEEMDNILRETPGFLQHLHTLTLEASSSLQQAYTIDYSSDEESTQVPPCSTTLGEKGALDPQTTHAQLYTILDSVCETGDPLKKHARTYKIKEELSPVPPHIPENKEAKKDQTNPNTTCLDIMGNPIEINLEGLNLTREEVHQALQEYGQQSCLLPTEDHLPLGLLTLVPESIPSLQDMETDTLRYQREINACLDFHRFKETDAKESFLWILVLNLGKMYHTKKKEMEEKAKQNIKMGDIFKDNIVNPQLIHIALEDRSLRQQDDRFFKTLLTDLPALEDEMTNLSFKNLVIKGEEIITKLNDKRFIYKEDKIKIRHSIYHTLNGISSVSELLNGNDPPDFKTVKISPTAPYKEEGAHMRKTFIPHSKLPTKLIITRMEDTQKQLKDKYEEFEKMIKKMKLKKEEKKTEENIADQKEEESYEENTEIDCKYCTFSHLPPKCTTETCIAPGYFQHDLLQGPGPLTRQICFTCDKRHLEVVVQKEITTEKDKIIDESFQITVALDSFWTSNPVQKTTCIGFLCNNPVYTQGILSYRKRGLPPSNALCGWCIEKFTYKENEDRNPEPEPLKELTNEEILHLYEDSASICFIQPPLGIHYNSLGDRNSDFGFYLPEDQIKIGFLIPDWATILPDSRPILFPDRSSRNTGTDLYRDVSKFHFLSKCIKTKRCVFWDQNKLHLKEQCGSHIDINHRKGRNDTITTQIERDLILKQSEESNLQTYSYFLVPPYESDYIDHKLVRDDESVQYGNTGYPSSPHLRINYEKLPKSRKELAKLGYSTRLLQEPFTLTNLNIHTKDYLRAYLLLETMYASEQDVWIKEVNVDRRMGDFENRNRIEKPYKPKIETKCHFLLCPQIPDAMDSENPNLITPTDGVLRDINKNPLPSHARKYFDEDSICYISPPLAVHYHANGSRIKTAFGEYQPEKDIKLADNLPDWDKEFFGRHPVLALPSHLSKISRESDLYRDLSNFHFISRCVLRKTCTTIESVKNGKDFKINLTSCNHGYEIKSKYNLEWEDQQSKDIRFAKTEDHGFDVFGGILLPPFREHYTPEGARKEEYGDYIPIPEVNHSIYNYLTPGFVTRITPSEEKTQMHRDFTAYISMNEFLHSASHYIDSERLRYIFAIRSPHSSDYNKLGGRLGQPFPYEVTFNQCRVNLTMIDPEELFKGTKRVVNVTLDEYMYHSPLISKLKSGHPNKNKGPDNNLFKQLVGLKRIVLKKPDLLVLGAETKQEKQLEDFEKAKTDLSIFGAFIPPPIGYTYNNKGMRKNGYRYYTSCPEINYLSITGVQLDTVSYKSMKEIPPDSDISNDMGQYEEQCKLLLQFGCEVKPPDVEIRSSQRLKVIHNTGKSTGPYIPTLQFIQNIKECSLLQKIIVEPVVISQSSLGTMHPNRTFQPGPSVNIADPEEANQIKLKRSEMYNATTNNQKDQVIYSNWKRNLSVCGSYVLPPAVSNYTNTSKRIQPYMPKIVLNEFHLPERYMALHYYTHSEEDPNKHLGKASCQDLQEDIKAYSEYVKQFLVLGSQLLPPSTSFIDDNGITPPSHAKMHLVPKFPDYIPHLVLRPTLEFLSKNGLRQLMFDPDFNPWETSQEKQLDPTLLARIMVKYMAIKNEKRIKEDRASARKIRQGVPRNGVERDEMLLHRQCHAPMTSRNNYRGQHRDNRGQWNQHDESIMNTEEEDNRLFITSPHPNQNKTVVGGHDEVKIQREHMDLNTRIIDFSRPRHSQNKPSAELTSRQKYNQRYNDARKDLTIFGSFITPPNESHYTPGGARMSPYKPKIEINYKNLDRKSFGAAFNFSTKFEDSIPHIRGTDIQDDYGTYTHLVNQLLKWGSTVLKPEEAMDVKNKANRKEADWDLLPIRVEFLHQSKYSSGRNRSENQYSCIQTHCGGVVRYMQSKVEPFISTLSPYFREAYFTNFSEHPNQLTSHRQTKEGVKPNPENFPHLKKNSLGHDQSTIAARLKQRDISIFGTYIHPPCKNPQQNLTYGLGINIRQVNYHRFTVDSFKKTHILTSDELEKLQLPKEEKIKMNRHFFTYKKTCYNLIQNGLEVSWSSSYFSLVPLRVPYIHLLGAEDDNSNNSEDDHE